MAYHVKRLENMYMKVILKVDMAQVCNPPTQKAEAGGSPQVHGWPEESSVFLATLGCSVNESLSPKT